MSLFNQFETDPQLEKNGIRVEYVTGEEQEGEKPATFIIARAGGANVAYDNMMDQRLKPLRRRLQSDNVSNKELEVITREVVAATVVKGWENVKDKKGNPIEFSVNAAIELFKALPDLYEDIRQQANKASLYRAANLEAAAKN